MINSSKKACIMSAGFVEVNENDFQALFVNTKTPPVNMVPLDHYDYIEAPDGIEFSRLFRVTYQYTKEGGSMRYHVLEWHQIQVKNHCKQSMKNQIDGISALREFLVPN